jgi:hypothetical protein
MSTDEVPAGASSGFSTGVVMPDNVDSVADCGTIAPAFLHEFA